MRRLIKTIWTLAAGIAIALVLAVGLTVEYSQIGDFELPQKDIRSIGFSHAGQSLEGSLITASANGPLVLIVHGDGPQDRWSQDEYLPLVNGLVDAGISVFSWDKPGVNASLGNWLQQSMQDRAEETAAALAAVKQLEDSKDRRIGLLGFSQAGWVLPRVPSVSDDALFLIVIGGAINWQAQGRYYATRRLKIEGTSPAAIRDELARQAIASERWFGGHAVFSDYAQAGNTAEKDPAQRMTEDRFQFVKLNYREDARNAIAALDLPVFVLSGEEDLNADARETIAVYSELLTDTNPLNRFELVPGATHSLLSARHYNYQLPSQWPLTARVRFILAGRSAYQGEVLKNLTHWIKLVSDGPQ